MKAAINLFILFFGVTIVIALLYNNLLEQLFWFLTGLVCLMLAYVVELRVK